MKLFNFILGILGIVLIIGAFCNFLLFAFLGGIATGSLTWALALPILLMILGATMAYFGFYYKGSTKNGNFKLVEIIKWGIIYLIAILISNYLLNTLVVSNNFLRIILTSFLVSIAIQAIWSHDHNHTFKARWFIFYFLVYADIIWVMENYILPKISITTGFLYSIVLGFVLAGSLLIIQKARLRYRSLPWISFILLLILLVTNISYLGDIGQISLASFNLTTASSEESERCPTPSAHPIMGSDITPGSVGSTLIGLINSTIWGMENPFTICYMGKYKNQYPDRIYCDNLIVSRWDKGFSGAINYKWYTAVSAEFKPMNNQEPMYYVLSDFVCENGQKVTVEKGVTNYYVYDARDGQQFKIEY